MQEVELYIEQLKVDVNTNSQAKAYELKDNLDAFIEQSLLPILQTYLQNVQAEISPERILEKLIIELNPSLDDFEFDVERQFKEQLEEQLFPLIYINSKQIAQSGPSFRDLNLETEQQALLEFFKTGDFPWWFPKPANSAAMEALFYKALEQTILKKQLVRLALSDERIKNRLIHQLPDGFLLSVLNSNQAAETAQLQTVLSEKFKSLRVLTTRFHFWNLIFKLGAKTISQSTVFEATSLLKLLTTRIDNSKKNKLKLFTKELLNTLKTLQVEQKLIEDFCNEKIIQSILNKNNKQDLNELNAPSNSSKNQIDSSLTKQAKNTPTTKAGKPLEPLLNKESQKATTQKELTRSKKSLEKGAEINAKNELESPIDTAKTQNQIVLNQAEIDAKAIHENGFAKDAQKDPTYYAEHCGLLLLHPFLGTFLKRCELLDENSKITNKAVVVKLLYYTATGLDFPYEHQTVLEKFIADYPKGISLDRSLPLAAGLKEKSDELIAAVLGHLPQLKSSSPALLRNEFLSRPGKLIINSNRTKIIVERKTQDLLLNQVPWNMALIKLPWLKNFIHLDW